MTQLLDLLDLRPIQPDSELNFLRSSWLRSYASTMSGVVPRATFMQLHWEVVMGLVDRPGTRTVVAAVKAHPEQILGFACGEASDRRAMVHYVYVKRDFRGQGLARALVEDVLRGGTTHDVTATHLPTQSMRKKLEAAGWLFRPQHAFYLAMENASEDHSNRPGTPDRAPDQEHARHAHRPEG